MGRDGTLLDKVAESGEEGGRSIQKRLMLLLRKFLAGMRARKPS